MFFGFLNKKKMTLEMKIKLSGGIPFSKASLKKNHQGSFPKLGASFDKKLVA